MPQAAGLGYRLRGGWRRQLHLGEELNKKTSVQFYKLPMTWAYEDMMDHISQYKSLGENGQEVLELFLFGWVDAQGDGGDYGLNTGPCENTFTTLITTTYMFQPEPAFVLQCRPYEMTPAQFDYVQEHDLDTQAFLEQLAPLPQVKYQLDLSEYKEASAALAALEELLKN